MADGFNSLSRATTIRVILAEERAKSPIRMSLVPGQCPRAMFRPLAKTLPSQVGKNMADVDWGQDPKLWPRVLSKVSVGRGVFI